MHPWLEQVSWAANAILAVVAIIGMFQIVAAVRQAKAGLEQVKISTDQLKIAADQFELSRKDAALTARRECISSALEQCQEFAKLIQETGRVANELKGLGYDPKGETDATFPFIPPAKDPKASQIWTENKNGVVSRILEVLNKHEAFAMYFVHGLADDQIAFPPTGQSFCNQCEFFATFIGLYRNKPGFEYYRNLVTLYQSWKTRLLKRELEQRELALKMEKNKLPVTDPLRALDHGN